MVTYLNMRTGDGVETVDEIIKSDFDSWTEYRAELSRLISEYHLCGMPVYSSSRSTKEWGAK